MKREPNNDAGSILRRLARRGFIVLVRKYQRFPILPAASPWEVQLQRDHELVIFRFGRTLAMALSAAERDAASRARSATRA